MINRPQTHQLFSYIRGSVGPITFRYVLGLENLLKFLLLPEDGARFQNM